MFDESAMAGLDDDLGNPDGLGVLPGMGPREAHAPTMQPIVQAPRAPHAPPGSAQMVTSVDARRQPYGPATPAMAVPMGPQQHLPPGYPQYSLPGMPDVVLDRYGRRQMAGQTFEWLEPQTADQSGMLRSAGVSAIFLAASFGLGVAVGGPWGAVAGVMLAGASMNAYRAQKWWGDPDPSKNFEATSSAIFGAGGLLIGGYAAYQAYQAKLKKTGTV